MKLIVFTMFFAGLSLVNAETKEFKMTAGNIIVENQVGNVLVNSEGGKTLKVNYEKLSGGKTCHLSIKKIENSVFVKVKQESASWFSFKKKNICKVNFVINAPKNIDADFKLAAGNLSVLGVNGRLKFKVGAGDVYIDGVQSESVIGKSGAGEILVNGDLASVDFKIGAGKVKTTFQKVIGAGSFDVAIGTGDVSLKVPNTSSVQTDFKSGAGSLLSEVNQPKDSQSTLSVNVKSGTGDLKIINL